MTTSFKLELRRGSVVIGKWRQGKYRVERLLGEGANGKVYLVQKDRDWYALKVGADAVDLQSEVNVLKSLAQQKGQGMEPFLFDVDDLYGPGGKEYPFYVMRYVRGTTLASYLKEQGAEWFPLVGLNLLSKLGRLHRSGWVFGDLKVENVMVADYGHVELVDFGGVTAAGKSIRQFTEIYDRGYWNSGSRAADPKYDLFSYSVLCIQLHDPKRLHQLTRELLPQNRSTVELMATAEGCAALKPVAGWLRKALQGEFRDADEGAAAWRLLMHRKETRRSTAMPGWLKGLVATSGILLAASIFVWLLRNVWM
ncbi:serine/threonine protein kinase [Paenibacillus sp. 1011MAR3C5]|uniref:serine/threonine protein kinase n=1 Tax=Paenibacillus sp. 1011MAR3C5 TaxID=1675787 RepID=UPI000E6B9D70|nr:serine/threonine protein kinase [Paenibacillus sp. 1011MAR3C5]RJE83584.1 serine/threonine protein kinase [Paenibacillus sp. 1011MAR3C5]